MSKKNSSPGYAPLLRPFGVEIECDIPARNAENIRSKFCGPYASQWKYGADCHVELRSPVFTGAEGLASLGEMYAALKEAGTRTPNCCGLHVHFNSDDMSDRDRARLANSWAANEKIIDAFVNASRHRNGYCRRLDGERSRYDFYTGETHKLGEGRFTEKQLPLKGDSINCKSYHGTIEVRKHHATTDFAQVAAWIRFCQAFIHTSMTRKNYMTCATDANALLKRLRVAKDAREQLAKKAAARA